MSLKQNSYTLYKHILYLQKSIFVRMQNSFEINGSEFHLNGKPFVIHAGEMHPSRIPKEYWEHRIQMSAAMGLNTISIYSFWNIHEPKPNEFDFGGWANVAEFVRLVQKHGMCAIIRPGPYCCAEWDLGGLPAWLLKSKTIRMRCNDSEYLQYVTRYLKIYLSELNALQIHKGGPILMFQLENEYGSYGRDKEYLKKLKQVYEEEGISVPLFTSDGGTRYYLKFSQLEIIKSFFKLHSILKRIQRSSSQINNTTQ